MDDFSRPRKQQFGVLEGVVLLFFLLIIGAVLIPNFTHPGNESVHYKRTGYGRGIYLGIQDSYPVIPMPWEEDVSYFPESSRFSNSNEYFVYLIQEGVLQDVWWEAFSADVLPPVPAGIDLEDPESVRQFAAENNFWSVVADITHDDYSGTPILISRNFDEPALRAATNPNDRPNVIKDKRFDGMVYFVNLGGAAGFIPIKDLTWEVINPAGATNKILHPGPPVP